MKLIKHLLLALIPLAAAVAFAACAKDNTSSSPKGDDDGDDAKDFAVELTLTQTDAQALEVACKPNNAETPYIVVALAKDAGDATETKIVEKLTFEARLAQKKIAEYVAEIQHTGEQNITLADLEENTEYFVCAYANDAKGAARSQIFKIEAKTVKPAALALSIGDVADMSAVLTIAAHDQKALYFYDFVPKSDYDAWGGDEKTIEYNKELMDSAIAYLAIAGYDISYSFFLSNGDSTMTADNLLPDTEYVFFAFGMDGDGNITSELVRADCKTTPFVATDNCTFAISTADVKATSMTVNVAPSYATTRYLVGITPKSAAEQYSLDKVAADFIEEINDINEQNNLTWATTPFVFTGAKNLASKDDLGYDTFTGGREYMIMVFGIDNEGRRTTVPATFIQRTAQVEQSATTFTIDVNSITVNGAKAYFTPTDDSETYFTDVMTYEEFHSYGSDQALIDYIVNTLGSNITAYLTAGRHEVDCTNMLVSDTKYVAYCFGYNNGATTKVFSKEFATAKLDSGSDAAVALQSVVEDGDIYEELYPEYKGKAVMSLLMTPNQSTSKWYCALTTDNRVLSMSNDDLAQWATMSSYINRKQMVYVGDWDTTIYVVTLALDSKGVAGVPSCYTIEITKSAAAMQSAVPSLSSVVRFAAPVTKAARAEVAPTTKRCADKVQKHALTQQFIARHKK